VGPCDTNVANIHSNVTHRSTERYLNRYYIKLQLKRILILKISIHEVIVKNKKTLNVKETLEMDTPLKFYCHRGRANVS
jgi:hypothetical protein